MNNYMNWFLYVFTLPPSPLRPLRDAATPSAAASPLDMLGVVEC